MAIFTVLTGALERNIPRTCTAENATMANSGDNQEAVTTYVADLTIDPVTGQADFSNNVPIVPQTLDMAQVRENMQQLLDIIIGFFEEEVRRVDSNTLKEEDMLFQPYDLQTDDTSTKGALRPLPEGFKRRRA